MTLFINRYRNLTVLLLVVAAQLLLLAYQVKSSQNVRLIRVWAVTIVTPIARALEGARGATFGFFNDYFILLDVRDENRRMKEENGRLKMENQFLKTELSTADRVRALAAFQRRSPSQTLAARIVGMGSGANAKTVYVDRGSINGVQKGMAVVTPDGIVGKVIDVYQFASQVLLITDPTFAAGVISQKNRVHGTLKGLGRSTCKVDYVQNEEKVDQGEIFYTSGDDRIFPKGLPAGEVNVVKSGNTFKEIYIVPSGFQNGLEEVLIVLEGVHQIIPEAPSSAPGIKMLPPPPSDGGAAPKPVGANPSSLTTDADRLFDRYKKIGELEHVNYGDPGSSKPPNFNVNVDEMLKKQQQQQAPADPAQTPTAPAPPPRPGQ